MQVCDLTVASGRCGADPSAAQDRKGGRKRGYLRASEPCSKALKPIVRESPPLDATPNMALKGYRFRYFGFPSLEKAIEVIFHEMLFEVFNP
jgi:hypothetical protein